MKKENYSDNVTEDNAQEFAVVPAADLRNIAEYVRILGNQLSFLEQQLQTMGIRTYDVQVKTLADLPIYKKPE